MNAMLVPIDVFVDWDYDKHPETTHTSSLKQKKHIFTLKKIRYGSSKVPDQFSCGAWSGTSKVPDQSIRVPDCSWEVPDGSSEVPDRTSKVTDQTSKVPDQVNWSGTF